MLKMVRVFINHVNSYTGRALTKVLGGTVVGSTVGGEEEETASLGQGGGDTYTILGTLSQSDARAPDGVTVITVGDNREGLLACLLECDIIVYHIIESSSQNEEATWAAQALHDQLPSFTTQKVFICVSSIMTWARSKPLDPDEPDVPLTEEDYRRRRPHPNFKDHIATEKLVIKLGKTEKTKFTSYVVAAGLTYGEGEAIFHFLFKCAWSGELPHLPVFGNGNNIVPTIHALDLGAVVLNIADSRPKIRYILAVDESHCSLTELVRTVSACLGTGHTQRVAREEALLNKDISQAEFDQLGVNLQMEAVVAKESMSINWKCESGLVENIVSVIKEYKESRGLLPIRACVLGPPAAGKTLHIAQLCQHYKLHHIKIDKVIRDAIHEQERLAARANENPAEGENEDKDGEDDGQAQEAVELLELLKEDKEANNGRYSEQYILQFYKSKLLSMPCQNQGFILDGFPKTYDQAKQLFAPEENDDEDALLDSQEVEAKPQYNKLLMPEVVMCLDANDEFLKHRVMHLPQAQVEGTHNTEEGLTRRIKLYREQNEEDVTVLNYFDELEMHPQRINVEDTPQDLALSKMKEIIGQPRNYGASPEEKAMAERRQQEVEEGVALKCREERSRQEAEEKALRAKREADWAAQLAKVQAEEQEMLETQSIPLRNYLMQHVMPTLTEGLIEVCKVKPDDAVDYLAEYLFKNNPQID